MRSFQRAIVKQAIQIFGGVFAIHIVVVAGARFGSALALAGYSEVRFTRLLSAAAHDNAARMITTVRPRAYSA